MPEENNDQILLFAIIQVIISIGYTLLLFLVVYPLVDFTFLGYTLGIINPQLIVYILPNFLNILFFIILAKMSLKELGFPGDKTWKGLLIAIGIIFLAEICKLIINIALGIRPLFFSQWTETIFITQTIGNWIGELFGNSLFEEILYRAILFPQLYIFFKRKEVFDKNLFNGLLALGTSQVIFALIHIPSRIIGFGFSIWDTVLSLLILFGMGWIFAAVYFVTESLLASMIIHGWYNIIFFNIFTPYSTSVEQIIRVVITLIVIISYYLIKRFLVLPQQQEPTVSSAPTAPSQEQKITNSQTFKQEPVEQEKNTEEEFLL
ncbi:MAG: CPBP family intramembrane glutamic endopeptidase [Asgard group archaeon]|nr:CPBP family intramembrane glutamic endopeptidase [Asgard group archaeon]